nr:hypothetical protein [uncultured Desulfobacter sp.]
MIIDPGFEKQIAYSLNLESIKNSKDVICIVDAEMKLKAYNKAWEAFALANGGENITQRYDLGVCITDVGEEPLKSFMRRKYREAIALNQMFGLNYECSSGQLLRVFRLNAYPLMNQKGLVISHHLVKACAHLEESVAFTKQFVNSDGVISQCMSCRKIKDPNSEDRWLWVPSLLEKGIANISHGICSRCLDHYYPDIG